MLRVGEKVVRRPVRSRRVQRIGTNPRQQAEVANRGRAERRLDDRLGAQHDQRTGDLGDVAKVIEPSHHIGGDGYEPLGNASRLLSEKNRRALEMS